jgi:hypothetical protein
VLPDDPGARAAQDTPEYDRYKDRVVELARDRNEVGDQRNGSARYMTIAAKSPLRPPIHARIGDEPLEQDQAIGDESGQRTSIAAATEHDEHEHADRVERHGRDAKNKEPVGHDCP